MCAREWCVCLCVRELAKSECLRAGLIRLLVCDQWGIQMKHNVHSSWYHARLCWVSRPISGAVNHSFLLGLTSHSIMFDNINWMKSILKSFWIQFAFDAWFNQLRINESRRQSAKYAWWRCRWLWHYHRIRYFQFEWKFANLICNTWQNHANFVRRLHARQNKLPFDNYEWHLPLVNHHPNLNPDRFASHPFYYSPVQ